MLFDELKFRHDKHDYLCILRHKISIRMHVIVFLSIYLSFYEKIIIISKYINLGLIMMN